MPSQVQGQARKTVLQDKRPLSGRRGVPGHVPCDPEPGPGPFRGSADSRGPVLSLRAGGSPRVIRHVGKDPASKNLKLKFYRGLPLIATVQIRSEIGLLVETLPGTPDFPAGYSPLTVKRFTGNYMLFFEVKEFVVSQASPKVLLGKTVEPKTFPVRSDPHTTKGAYP